MPLFSPTAANRGEAEACLEKAKIEASIAERTARYTKALKLAKKAIQLFGNPYPQEAKNLLHSLELKQKNSRPSNYRAPNSTEPQQESKAPTTPSSSTRRRFVNTSDPRGGWENKESSARQRSAEDAKDNGNNNSPDPESIDMRQYFDLSATINFLRSNSIFSYPQALNDWFDRLPLTHESLSTIKKLLGITLFLGGYRLVFGRVTLFSLPGDFNYQSPTEFISFPLLSTIVIMSTIQAVFILMS